MLDQHRREDFTMTHAQHHTSEMDTCIELCRECEQLCTSAIPHCLELGGRHAAPAHIRLLIDCADICGTSSRFMMRDSRLHADTCRACAKVCDNCAHDCRQLGDDAEMLDCAEMCERCANACRKLAEMA